jgi:hypothetical protein
MRGAFWGGLIAHTLAALAASVAGMYEPAEWVANDRVRGFFGYWSMLIFFIVGAGAGALVNGRRGLPRKQVQGGRSLRDKGDGS